MEISTLLRGARPAHIGAWSLIAASSCLGAFYGFSLGYKSSLATGLLFGLAALGGEVLKPFAVEAAYSSLAKRMWGKGAIAVVLAIACLAYSFSAELRFTATALGDDIAVRQSVVDDVAKVKGSRDTLAASLAALPTPKQASAWQKEIDATLANKKAGGCVEDNGPFTKANCPRVRDLRTKIGQAERRPAILAEIARLDAELSKQRIVGEADPAAASIAAYAGALGVGKWEADQVSPWLSVLPVLFIEIGSAFGLLLAGWSTPRSTIAENPVPMPVHAVPDVHGITAEWTGPSEGAEIIDFLKAQGGQFKGGQQRIAERLGMSKTTVNRRLKELREKGLLVTEEARGSTMFKLAN